MAARSTFVRLVGGLSLAMTLLLVARPDESGTTSGSRGADRSESSMSDWGDDPWGRSGQPESERAEKASDPPSNVPASPMASAATSEGEEASNRGAEQLGERTRATSEAIDDGSDGREGSPGERGAEGDERRRPEIGVLQLGGQFCTGTLIAPRAVVTAKHCVEGARCDSATCQRELRGDFSVPYGDGRHRGFPVSRYVTFRLGRSRPVPMSGGTKLHLMGAGERGHLRTDDVALLLLERPVPASLAEPAEIAESLPEEGTRLSAWGYGCTERGEMPDFVKRRRPVTVGETSNGLCQGDSGGPVTRGIDGPIVYVNTGYRKSEALGDVDVFGDVVSFRGLLWRQLAIWRGSGPASEP